MSINLAILGSKVAAYRQQLSDTVDEVAMATGVPGERIAAIEAGVLEPTGDEILILSDYFRCDYKVFLSNDAAAGSPPAQALYRAKSEDFNKDDRRAVRDFLYLCETEHELASDSEGSPSHSSFPRQLLRNVLPPTAPLPCALTLATEIKSCLTTCLATAGSWASMFSAGG